MRFAVCDDEKIFIDCFESVVYEQYSRLDIDLCKYTDGPALLADIDGGLVLDAYFLDIEMSDMDGMSLASDIHKRLPDVPVIFLTSHLEMAIEGYEVGAFRFLKKPPEKDKIYQTIEDLKKLSYGKKGVILKVEGEETVIIPGDVLFIESENNDIRIITTKKTYTTRMKLSDALDLFNEVNKSFIKIHRCSLVNMTHVAGIREKDVVLDNGAVISVSRGCYKNFKDAFYTFIKSSAR